MTRLKKEKTMLYRLTGKRHIIGVHDKKMEYVETGSVLELTEAQARNLADKIELVTNVKSTEGRK